MAAAVGPALAAGTGAGRGLTARDRETAINANRDSTPALLLQLWHRLAARRRRQLVLLLALMLGSALAEVVSLGAVLPFLGVLVAPDRLLQQPLVAALARAAGAGTASELVLVFTVLFALAALVAGAIRMLVLWASTRLSFAIGVDLSQDVYRRTLYQPYRVHAQRNSSEVISAIITKIGTTINVIFQVLNLCSSFLLLSALIVALLVIDPFIAGIAAVGFGASYGAISCFLRNRLKANSERIADKQTQLLKALQEGLGGIRDVLLDGTQPLYCCIYRDADIQVRRAQGNNMFIAGSPRYVMEVVGMILIAGLAYGASRHNGGMIAMLPALGALALGAQRLLPALQQVYVAWVTIAGSQKSTMDILDFLQQPLPPEALITPSMPIPFREEIRFENVRFRYAEDQPWVLDGIDLKIPRGAKVGIVGHTGSGKSTLLDLLMGLLTPVEGRIYVDDCDINGEHLRAWQLAVAHVPQNIFLSDASLAENIAFGIPPGAIDMERVRQAAAQAQIAEFIESSPEGYAARVGERGIRLSGGQRQRIGIARALYKQASILVFDEATSALDTVTEGTVMEAIDGLDRNLTVVLIAHRLTTLRHCDFIIELERGHIAAPGSHAGAGELAHSHDFRGVEQARSREGA